MLQQKPFILIVEDDMPLRKVLTRYLQAVGYMVIQAASFHEATNKMEIRPNLVILDINLPDATGWDVADWIESLTRPMPVIVMSGVVQPTQKQLEKVGAKAFLSKPFAVSDLLSLVKEYVPLPQGRSDALPM